MMLKTKKRSFGSCPGRILLWSVIAILVLIILGFAYQTIGQAVDRSAIQPPGRLYEVNGENLHLYCVGEGSSTVVLEAGAMGFAQTWAWIQADLAQTTRVCSYDRAGMGWSAPTTAENDGVATARNLKALLEKAGEPGPYILVGHSLGGPFVEIFTSLYPNDVVALGLVDPSHPDQLEKLGPVAREEQAQTTAVLQPLSIVSYVGVMRAGNLLGQLWKDLPEDDYRAARMFLSTPEHLRASRIDYLMWDQTMGEVREITTFGDTPVVVISSTGLLTQDMLKVMWDLHAEMAAMSTSGIWVKIEGADHFSLLANQTYASEVSQQLQTLIEGARK